jgi:hypothetical protein
MTFRSPGVAVAVVLASLGGPLALVVLYLPGGAELDRSSAATMVVAGAVAFAATLLVWWRFLGEETGDGGLVSFVERGLGRAVALPFAGLWAVAYVLYLPYTSVELGYGDVAIVLPATAGSSGGVSLAIACLVIVLALLPFRTIALGLASLVVVELALLVALGLVDASRAGIDPVLPGHGAVAFTRGAAGVALLYVCLSLPTFLGRDVAGGSRGVRRAMVAGLAIFLPVAVVATLGYGGALARIGGGGDAPGYAVLLAAGHATLARAVGLAAIAAEVGLAVLELVVLTRVARHLLGWTPRRTVLVLAPFVLGATALAPLDPERVYRALLVPALFTLYASLLVVAAAYPAWRWRRGRLGAGDLPVTALAVALPAWGLWLAISGQVG